MSLCCDVPLLLQLAALPGLGARRIQQLLQRYPLSVLVQAEESQWRDFGLNTRQINALRSGSVALERALNWLENPDHHLICLSDDDYPTRLKQTIGPPPVLFVLGEPTLLSSPQIAIVGSRNADPVMLELTSRLAAELAAVGLTITSGLALGVDGAAHHGALTKGKTIAVMGTGPDRIYPRRHRQLASAIVEQGALVSEFFPGVVPKAQNFPRRNRVISGLSLGVIVTEAALRSGSLITARYAVEQNRELFAIPGSIANPLAEGPHHLIQQGAKLITCSGDVLDELWPLIPELLDKLVTDTDNIDQQQLPSGGLLDNVGYETTSVDQVVERSLLPVDKVVSALIKLEMSGEIMAVPGGYVRLRRTP